MKLVLDASVALSWLQLPTQPFSSEAMTILSLLHKNPAYVPMIWPLEVAHGALRVERSKAVTESALARFSDLVQSAPVIIESRPTQARLASSVSIAREHRITVYDATYLELAMFHGAPLATFDKRLAQAAGTCGVSLETTLADKLEEPTAHYGIPPATDYVEIGCSALRTGYTPYFVR